MIVACACWAPTRGVLTLYPNSKDPNTLQINVKYYVAHHECDYGNPFSKSTATVLIAARTTNTTMLWLCSDSLGCNGLVSMILPRINLY